MNDELKYHYCSIETFKAIIENKTLRFSDITKSNDSAELRYISKYLDNAFETEISRIQKEGSYESISSINPRALFNKFKDAYFNRAIDGKDKTFWFYTSCFSLERDSLSQWRGYAEDGKGFCIGFDGEYFEKINSNNFNLPSIKLGLIEYEEKKQVAMVNECIRELIDILVDLAKENTLDITIASAHYMDCFQTLLGKAVFSKNHFFHEENEWRMSFMYFDGGDSTKDVLLVQSGKPVSFPIKYQKRENELVSYFDLKWDPVVVKEIILGPKNHSDLSDVKKFIKNNGFNCNVIRSDGTYI